MASSSSAVAAAPLPPQLEELLASVDRSLAAVEASLEPFLEKPLKHVVTQLQPLDNARLNTSLAFCSASLLYSFLRIGGTDPRAPEGPGSDPHPVMEEVAAVKRLYGRVEEAGKQVARVTGGARNTSRLDVVAAGRFIKAGLAGNDREEEGGGDDDGAVGEQEANASAAAASSSSASGVHVAAGPSSSSSSSAAGDASGGFAGRKRGREAAQLQAAGQGGAPANKRGATSSSAAAAAAPPPPPSSSGRTEGGHRSTPQPSLAHLDWKHEMAKRFGGAGAGKK